MGLQALDLTKGALDVVLTLHVHHRNFCRQSCVLHAKLKVPCLSAQSESWCVRLEPSCSTSASVAEE